MAPEEIVPWRGDFNAALEEAKSSGKPLLAYFTADWCAPCHTLRSTTWADRGVETALRAYVPVRIDIMANTPVALRYNAEAIPKYAVLDGEGNVLKSADGYMNSKEFLAWLKE